MKFTTELPSNYANEHTVRYALYHPPVPNAESVDWRMVDSKWQQVKGPDLAKQAGDVRVMLGFMLGAYHQQNIDGANWSWAPMTDFVAAMQGGLVTPSGQDQLNEIRQLRAQLQLAEKRMQSHALELDTYANEIREALG